MSLKRSVSIAARVAVLLAALALAAGCSWLGGRAREQAGGPPNVVLILVDDLGYRDVSYNGASEIETPNIDRLAAEGVVFSSGYVVHPFCGPSRAGAMTGRYPARFGMEWNVPYAPFDPEQGLPEEETTLARRLQDAGYRTGLIGKWQLGAAPPFHPLNRGFGEFYGFLAGGHDYFQVDVTRAPADEYLLPLSDGRGAGRFSGYLTDALTDRAVEFVRDDDIDAPFFLYLAYNAPHAPLQAPADLVARYGHIADEDRRTYLAMVDSLDRNVGRVLDALEDAGKRSNTIVFFLSDNGGVVPLDYLPDEQDWADNAPFRGGKSTFLEGGLRVPFVASWPAGWPQGAAYDRPVISLDAAATALALAGATEDPARPLDGVNLDPFVRGEASGPPHEALFWRQWRNAPDLVTYAVLTAGGEKLVKEFDQAPALYDLRSDIGETRDLAAADPETVARLQTLWNEWNRGNPGNLFPNEADYQRDLKRYRGELADLAREHGLAGASP